MPQQQIAEQFKRRAPRIDEAEAVTALMNKHFNAIIRSAPRSVARTQSSWERPRMNLQKDFCVVESSSGEIVGYAVIWNDSEPYVEAFLEVYVDPDWKNQGIGSMLNTWAEARAREIFEKAPDDARLDLIADIYTNDVDSIALLKDIGYEQVRNFWTMKIDLDGELPEPVFPDGIHMSNYAETGDLYAIYKATDTIFRDHWGHVEQPEAAAMQDWREWTDSNKNPHHDPTSFWLAMCDGEIAGISLCTPKMAENPDWGYVYTLGVQRDWRRQGLALAMLQYTFQKMKARGKSAVLLDVDAASLTGATRLYEKAGMSIFRHSVAYEKNIRTGKDYRTQAVE